MSNPSVLAAFERMWQHYIVKNGSGAAGVSSWNDLTDKPFGEEAAGEYLVKNYQFEGTFEHGSVTVEIPDVQLVENETYTATIDGEMFTSTAQTWKGVIEFYLTIGDKMIYVKTTSTGIEVTYTDGVVDSVTRDLTFSMWVGDGTVMKPIDEKYIPDNIARLSDVEALITGAIGGSY